MKKFWNKDLEQLKPYTPGEQPKDKKYIKLNTNESPYPPSPSVYKAIEQANCADLRLYPDPEVSSLRQVIAQRYKIQHDNVFIGNGSDEILAFAYMAFCNVKDKIYFPDISYSFYTVYANLFKLTIQSPKLDDQFRINPNDYAHNDGAVLIANPNAPTGMALGLDAIAQIARQNPDHLVLVDEAYIDFGGNTALELVSNFDNLLVVQTFSKSRSLAGLRLGFAVGQAHLIEALERVKYSFNSYTINRLSLVAGVASFSDQSFFNQHTQLIIATRIRFIQVLEELNFTVLPSTANFVFAKHPNLSGPQLYAILRNNGILVRHFNADRIVDFLRITIGTDAEMDEVITCLKNLDKSN